MNINEFSGKKSDEVVDWLREIGFEAYIDRFLSNGYDNLNVSTLLIFNIIN